MSNTLENSTDARAEIGRVIGLMNGLLAYCNESGYWLLPCNCMIIHKAEVTECEICLMEKPTPTTLAALCLTGLSDTMGRIQLLLETMVKENK